MFGSEDPPSCHSLLITVSARHGPDTEVEIKYGIPIRGTKPANRKIYIIRSLGNSRNGKLSIIFWFISKLFEKEHLIQDQLMRLHKIEVCDIYNYYIIYY